MAPIALPPLPDEWTRHVLDPKVGGVTPPALMARFDRVRADRRADLQHRYGDHQLGAALAIIVLSYGLSKRPVSGGRDPWAIVDAWNAQTAAWLKTIPNSVDAWDPLAREVALCRKVSNMGAWRIAKEIREVTQARSAAGEVMHSSRNAPERARALLLVGTTDEAYAYCAVHKWRVRAALAGELLTELEPPPEDPGESPESDEDGDGQTALAAALDSLPDDAFEPPKDWVP